MRILSFAFIGSAGVGLVLSSAVSSASNASSRTLVAPALELRGATRRPIRQTRIVAAPISCATNAPSGHFVGISGASDVAAGAYSGVLGGEGNSTCGDDEAIEAGENNTIGGLYQGSFIGAGEGNALDGTLSAIGAGDKTFAGSGNAFAGAGATNAANAHGSFVGSGVMNNATGEESAVVAGLSNETGGVASFSGGGIDGYSSASGGAFIGSGEYETDGGGGFSGSTVGGNDAFLGAGDVDYIDAAAAFAGAPSNSTIAALASYSTIVDGSHHEASATYANILGGYGNTASGSYAVVAGGDSNTASGVLSLAGGYHADAGHNGSFVWSDYSSGSATLKDAAVNQFVARASGGIDISTNESRTSGVTLAPGSGTWASLSDRNAKTGVVPLDDASILAKVSSLPVDMWRYRSETGVRHAGPMAQDFYAAFGTGVDDRHLTSIDEDGVALSAIKAVARDNARLQTTNDRMSAENRLLRATLATLAVRTTAAEQIQAARNAALERRLDSLAARLRAAAK